MGVKSPLPIKGGLEDLAEFYKSKKYKKWQKSLKDKKMPEKENLLFDFIEDFGVSMKTQLVEDEKRWGDTWRRVPIEGQEIRIAARLQRYFSDFSNYKLPIPWLKIANYALIAWVKENNPELVETQDNVNPSK